MTIGEVAGRSRWKARPVLAFALSLTVIALPVVLSLLATLTLGKALVGMGVWPKIAVLGIVAIVVGLLAERVCDGAAPRCPAPHDHALP